MATTDNAGIRPVTAEQRWYAIDPEQVANTLGVDVDTGLSAAEAAERLKRDGPNALPEEKPPSRLRRLLGQYTSYMQIILVGASVVSLVIKQWSTAIVLFVLSLINAITGLRQEGKAESAMNALKSMMEATARVRRDGVEAEIPAEQLVVGDVVLIAAGDEIPADGRIVSSSSLQIDESALTGESVPAAKDAKTLSDGDLGAGDQENMAFMHTPVTHGSGVMIVTSVGGQTEVGKIAGMLSATETEETPLTKQMNTLTLWIVGAAGITMIIMFALGLYRGQSWTMLFTTAVALAIAAIPLALPMVVQVVLSLGSVELAKQKAIVKDLPSVETLGFTSAINSDKTGTLTMNQMTAIEVVDPTDRYAVTGTGYSLEGKISHPAGKTDTLDAAILPYVIASDTRLVDGKVVGDPTEGALLVLAHKAGVYIDATREELPRLATLPFDPSYKLMATFNQAKDAAGNDIVRCFVKGAAPAVLARAATALANGTSVPWDDHLRQGAEQNVERMGGAGLRVMAGAFRDLDAADFDPAGDLLGYVTDLQMTSLVGMVDPPRVKQGDFPPPLAAFLRAGDAQPESRVRASELLRADRQFSGKHGRVPVRQVRLQVRHVADFPRQRLSRVVDRLVQLAAQAAFPSGLQVAGDDPERLRPSHTHPQHPLPVWYKCGTVQVQEREGTMKARKYQTTDDVIAQAAGTGPPPPPKRWWRRKGWVIAGCILVAPLMLIGVILAFSPGSTTGTTGATSPAVANPAAPAAQPAPAESPNAEGSGSCDTSLSSALYGQDYLTASVHLKNTGNVGQVVKVTVWWPQQGFDPIKAHKTMRLAFGAHRTANLHVPVSTEQISRFQDEQLASDGDPCNYRIDEISTYGPAH